MNTLAQRAGVRHGLHLRGQPFLDIGKPGFELVHLGVGPLGLRLRRSLRQLRFKARDLTPQRLGRRSLACQAFDRTLKVTDARKKLGRLLHDGLDRSLHRPFERRLQFDDPRAQLLHLDGIGNRRVERQRNGKKPLVERFHLACKRIRTQCAGLGRIELRPQHLDLGAGLRGTRLACRCCASSGSESAFQLRDARPQRVSLLPHAIERPAQRHIRCRKLVLQVEDPAPQRIRLACCRKSRSEPSLKLRDTGARQVHGGHRRIPVLLVCSGKRFRLRHARCQALDLLLRLLPRAHRLANTRFCIGDSWRSRLQLAHTRHHLADLLGRRVAFPSRLRKLSLHLGKSHLHASDRFLSLRVGGRDAAGDLSLQLLHPPLGLAGLLPEPILLARDLGKRPLELQQALAHSVIGHDLRRAEVQGLRSLGKRVCPRLVLVPLRPRFQIAATEGIAFVFQAGRLVGKLLLVRLQAEHLALERVDALGHFLARRNA